MKLRKNKYLFVLNNIEYQFQFGITNFSNCVFPYWVGLLANNQWLGSTGVPEYKLKMLRKSSDEELISEMKILFKKYPWQKQNI